MNEEAFQVLRCEDCGDTFPSQEGPPRPDSRLDGDVVAATCPSCGSGRLLPATEPLL